jgi:hypothetical protein
MKVTSLGLTKTFASIHKFVNNIFFFLTYINDVFLVLDVNHLVMNYLGGSVYWKIWELWRIRKHENCGNKSF